MKKIIYLLTFVIFCSCEHKNEPSTIIVEGKSLKSVTTNNARIEIAIISRDISHRKTTSKLETKYRILLDSLSTIGIDNSRIKTISFQIEKEQNYTENEKTDLGFIGTHDVELVLDKDLKNIGQIVDLLYNLNLELVLNINYFVNERTKKEIKKKLLESCLADAKLKAEKIAELTGSKITKVLKVRYGNTQKYYYLEDGIQTALFKLYEDSNRSSDIKFDVTPKEIEVEESIVVTWQIE